MHARGDACTRGLGYVCLNMKIHMYTCSRPICKFLLYSDDPERVFQRNPDPWASDRLPPRCSSERGSPVYIYLDLCLFRSYIICGAMLIMSCGNILPGFPGTGSFPLIQVPKLRLYITALACEGGRMLPGTRLCVFQYYNTHLYMC